MQKTEEFIGAGGELHQVAGGSHPPLTTQTGAVVADDENSLRGGQRGPTVLEDAALLEKIQHFDYERIPERIVHARDFSAHGYFELTDSLKGVSRAAIFNEVGIKTPVFVGFSTVAGNKGSTDLALSRQRPISIRRLLGMRTGWGATVRPCKSLLHNCPVS
jgi:catalase